MEFLDTFPFLHGIPNRHHRRCRAVRASSRGHLVLLGAPGSVTELSN